MIGTIAARESGKPVPVAQLDDEYDDNIDQIKYILLKNKVKLRILISRCFKAEITELPERNWIV